MTVTGPGAWTGTPVSRAGRILVISGRRLLAEALQQVLGEQPGVEECSVVCTDEDLRAAVRASVPTTVLLDLDEPGAGLELISDLLQGTPGVRRIGFYDTFTARKAQMAFEVSITVLRPLASPIDHIVEAVLADSRTSSVTAAEGVTRDQLTRLASLTPREVEVLQHLAHGRPVKVVARLLRITEHTVDTHKRRCFRKLGVQHQAHAVALAVSGGLVTSGEPGPE